MHKITKVFLVISVVYIFYCLLAAFVVVELNKTNYSKTFDINQTTPIPIPQAEPTEGKYNNDR